jgi:oligopeptide transport system substrate-binding protein
MVAAASAEQDPRSRYEFYQQAEARLLDEAPIVPLFFGTRVFLCHPAVKNWRPALLGIHQYKDVYLEQ